MAKQKTQINSAFRNEIRLKRCLLRNNDFIFRNLTIRETKRNEYSEQTVLEKSFGHIEMTFGPKRLWGLVKVDCRFGHGTGFSDAASKLCQK